MEPIFVEGHGARLWAEEPGPPITKQPKRRRFFPEIMEDENNHENERLIRFSFMALNKNKTHDTTTCRTSAENQADREKPTCRPEIKPRAIG